jgi:toxin ParE1/3/4
VERTRYYRSEGGEELGGRFFNAAIESLGAVESMPGAGSPRIGELCGVPGLRSRRVAGFPCGWFYFERADHVDVVRLVAYAQDLATLLGDVDQHDW